MDSATDHDPVDELAEDFVRRYRAGERPAVSEYTDKYPQWADRIRRVFPVLVMMERFKPASESDENRWGDTDAGRVQVHSFGDYRILREIGRGGMGIVYEAEQISLGRHVALKVLPAHRFSDASRVQRFQREAKAAARLHHTNIVPVHGVGEHEGMHYYVMQYIPGLGLDQVMEEVKRLRGIQNQRDEHGTGGPLMKHTSAADLSASSLGQSMLTGCFARLDSQDEGSGALEPAPSTSSNPRDPSPPRAVQVEQTSFTESGRAYWRSVARIGLQTADALGYAHGQGTMHRDIKPSNLLLDDYGIVWITDFGLAKATDDADNLTDSGDLVGTMRYMAPERFQGVADHRSDLFSLGLTLYELLTFRPAFDQRSRSRLMEQVLQGEPPRPRKINAAIPRDLETVVLKALEREPGRRYQTAAQMAGDLRCFLEDKPIRARRAGLGERALKWAKRRPAIAALTLAVLLTSLIGLLGIVWQWRQAVSARNHLADSLERESHALADAKAAKKEAEYFAAVAKEQAAKAVRQAARAQRVSEFLTELFLDSDPTGLSTYLFRGHGKANSAPASPQILKAGADRINLLDETPEIKAALMDKLGGIYLSLGMLERAEGLLTKALQIRENSEDVEREEVGRSLRNMGALRLSQGNHLEAIELLAGALAIFGEQSREVNITKVLLALAEFEREDTEATLDELEQSLRAVIESQKELSKDSRRVFGVSLAYIALARVRRGNTAKSLALVSQAKQQLAELGAEDEAEQMFELAMSGIYNFYFMGNQQQGLREIRQAVAKCRDVFGEGHLFVQLFQVELARAFHRVDGWMKPAEDFYRDAIASAQKSKGQKLREALWLMYLGDLHFERGELEEAETHYRKAAAFRSEHLGADHPDTVAATRALTRPRVLLFDSPHYKSFSIEIKKTEADLAAYGFDDRASSLKYWLPKGWKLHLYESPGFQGQALSYSGTAGWEAVASVTVVRPNSIKIVPGAKP